MYITQRNFLGKKEDSIVKGACNQQEVADPVYIPVKEQSIPKKSSFNFFNTKNFVEEHKQVTRIELGKASIKNSKDTFGSFNKYFNVTSSYIFKKLLLVIAPYTDLVILILII